MSLPRDSHLPRWGPSAFLHLICPGGGSHVLWGLKLTSPHDDIWRVTFGIYLYVGWHVTSGIYPCMGWHLPLYGLMITSSSDGLLAPMACTWLRFDSVLRWYVAVAHGVVVELMPTSFH